MSKRICFSITSVLVVVLTSGIQPTLGEEDAVHAAAKGVRQIIAHRGSSADRPECTLASLKRAIAVGATSSEVDVRRSKDGQLVILHDTTLDRTTNGKGPVGEKTLAELKQLDAGSWFDPKFKDERIPTLREVLIAAKGKIAVLLDLKEQGRDYAEQVAAEVKKFGEPKQTVVGVRSVEQAKLFRALLPQSRQLGLIPNPESIESFTAAGVETIRLWPRWLKDESLVGRVRRQKAKLHLNGTTGVRDEVVPLLKYRPDSLSSDNPARLIKTLKQIAGGK